MRVLRCTRYLIVGIWLAGCAIANANPGGQATVLEVLAQGQDDRIDVSVKDRTAYLDVHSGSGIGSAQIKLVSGGPLEQIFLRLHLKGLEELRITDEPMAMILRVSSGENPVVMQSVIDESGEELQIAPGQPNWIDFQIVANQPSPRIPLEQGYFELLLPAEMLNSGDQSVSIHWIDFFR